MTATSPSLTSEVAAKFARLALAHVTREYPNDPRHIINDAADIKSPRELHPIFFGSLDWHSCVHGYWLLATVRRLFPTLAEVRDIDELFAQQLTPANVTGEVNYLHQPLRNTFERPYGWAWLLMLAGELHRADSQSWRDVLQPLAEEFASRFKRFLPKATYPTRVGTHFNSAFAITLALEYARALDDGELETLLSDTATRWFLGDSGAQVWEPNGDDFLSSVLIEAECMRRVLGGEFPDWFANFLPRVAEREPATLFTPATVSDRSDGKIAHLDGLNLSRAWCWRSLAQSWQPGDERRAIALDAAEVHLEASLPYVSGDYMGEHWLATFALLALL
ncbi:MAG TPA: DUF2891 domain-containing protein [Gemmatimonadaceae bacterium]|nr:DUF2891 domain-containing protein [Gemmatimonadaceae bacterium]